MHIGSFKEANKAAKGDERDKVADKSMSKSGEGTILGCTNDFIGSQGLSTILSYIMRS